jgi:hypothetical protein
MFTMCGVSAQDFLALEDTHVYPGFHTLTADKDANNREYTRWAVDSPTPTYQKQDESGELVKFKRPELRGLQAEVFYNATNFVSHFNAYPS